MPDVDAVTTDAGAMVTLGAMLGFEDAGQRRLRYHLLRLTVIGLTPRDVEDLGELASLAFAGSDVADRAARIRARPDASPLAAAIGDIVAQSAAGVGGPASLADIMLGAVLGAYAGMRDDGGDRTEAAIAGAAGGAIAIAVAGLERSNIDAVGTSEYLRMDE
jgi:hypothetical protein